MNKLVRKLLCGSLATGVMALSAGIPASADVATVTAAACSSVTAPVAMADPGPANMQISGQLCWPQGQTPSTVQLLVHGGTYTRAVWDWPQNPGTYSYVQDAVAAGYATFSVDRLGYGASSHPPGADVTIASGAIALHSIVTRLRSGAIAGWAFSHVVMVSASLGSVVAYEYGGRYTDIDAYVLTGSVHFLKPSWLNMFTASLTPAGSIPGYQTTIPGSRASLFYHAPTADPAVVAQDEAMKDTLTGGELATAPGLVTGPSALSPTMGFDVPVMIVIGQFDNLVCGGPDGMTCTPTALQALEMPYFPFVPSLTVLVVPNSGHQISQHPNAPFAHAVMLGWIQTIATP